MKKVLVIGQNKNDKNGVDIVKAIEKNGQSPLWCEYRDLAYEINEQGLEIYFEKKPIISDGDFFILRGSGVGNAQYSKHRNLIAKELVRRGKRVLNGDYFVRFSGRADKMVQHQIMAHEGIPILPSKIIGSVAMLEDELPEYPFVTKPVEGSHGEGVRKVSTKTGVAVSFTHNLAQELLIQPVINGGVDYRVIVLDGEVLGAISRKAVGGSFVTNVSAGGVAEKFEVTEEMRSLAIKAAKAFDLEYVGVDIMQSDIGLVVLEVNAQAEFQGFNKATGINAADEMVKYLLESANE